MSLVADDVEERLDPVDVDSLPKGTKLPTPPGVDPKRYHVGYLTTFVVIHTLALLIFVPWFFSWAGVGFMLFTIFLFGQLAIPIGYHRLLTHRSFKAPKWFERTLATMAMCAGQETPARWVAWHRMHHIHSDHVEDPHTPLVSFFWSHMNWLVHETRGKGQTYAMFDKYARDILKDPYYLWIEKIPLANGVFFWGHALICLVLGWFVGLAMYGFGWESTQLTLSLFVWGVIARTVWVWHTTWSVNSLTHTFGYRNFPTTDGSRNNWFVTLFTGGEGWHNNHHADQSSASVQIRWWEIDVNYYVIRLFGLVGLAKNIIPPRHVRERQSEGRKLAAQQKSQ